jgi:hypothetical protein
VSSHLHARPLYPWDKLGRRLGGPQSRSGRYGEEKNLTPARNRTSVVQPVIHRCTDRPITSLGEGGLLNFMVKVRLREGKALGSEKGRCLGCGFSYEQR